ncbi:hypothetical protein [Streptosporangium sp. KLBMP 9127]|nr:hypothetical protein [Streptosporangium sp. KLBMP 9127]
MPSLSPCDLTCAFLDRPRGVDETVPRRAWKPRSTARAGGPAAAATPSARG